MTLVEVLEATAVAYLSVFKKWEKWESRFKDNAKATITLQYILLSCQKRKEFSNIFRDIQNLLKTC